jgi:hypothetical protein
VNEARRGRRRNDRHNADPTTFHNLRLLFALIPSRDPAASNSLPGWRPSDSIRLSLVFEMNGGFVSTVQFNTVFASEIVIAFVRNLAKFPARKQKSEIDGARI